MTGVIRPAEDVDEGSTDVRAGAIARGEKGWLLLMTAGLASLLLMTAAGVGLLVLSFVRPALLPFV